MGGLLDATMAWLKGFFICSLKCLLCIYFAAQRVLNAFGKYLSCVHSHGRQKLCRACRKKRTAKSLWRAKCCHAGFAVPVEGKRAAKNLPCIFETLPCVACAWQMAGFP
jgi:hypothetical protein